MRPRVVACRVVQAVAMELQGFRNARPVVFSHQMSVRARR
jgi:hypothetical protein